MVKARRTGVRGLNAPPPVVVRLAQPFGTAFVLHTASRSPAQPLYEACDAPCEPTGACYLPVGLAGASTQLFGRNSKEIPSPIGTTSTCRKCPVFGSR